MCGRAYQTYTEEELEIRYLNERSKRRPSLGIMSGPNYNLSPTQTSPIVLIEGQNVVIKAYRWGLVPFWAKDVLSAAKYSLINARSEEVETKRSYAAAFKKRRCIVPVSGFFEWHRIGPKEKKPYSIYLKDKSIMSLAGVYEHWESADTGEVVDSFSLLTVGANSLMSQIHDRMPVILNRDDEEAWLDPKNDDLAQLHKLMRPYAADAMAMCEISRLVNSPKNNVPEILDPV